jgi:hypothetical protein
MAYEDHCRKYPVCQIPFNRAYMNLVITDAWKRLKADPSTPAMIRNGFFVTGIFPL